MATTTVMGDDDDVRSSNNNRWLRYGKCLPESLEITKKTNNGIDATSPTNVALVFGRCCMYYVDVVLDLFVSVTYIEDGNYMWAAVTLFIFATFICTEFVRSRDLAVNHDLSYLRTSVFTLPWTVLFAKKKESPELVDRIVSIQLDSLLSEGLFEAPSQLSFQLFVVMQVWGVHGQPSFVQLGSVAISILSLGSASASTFDVPYIYCNRLGKRKGIRDMSHMVSIVPYFCVRGFQLMYRVISLALMFLTFGVTYGALLLLPMLVIRVYMLSPLYGAPNTTLLAVLVGSLFSDGFLGDAHFREHLAKGGMVGSAGASGTWTILVQVAPTNQQAADDEEEEYSIAAAASPNLAIHSSSVRKESLRRVEPTPQALSGEHESHGALPNKKQGEKEEEEERRRIRRAQKSLMVSEDEVCAEVKMVVCGILLVAVECWLCFAAALVNLDRFEVDRFVIGWMALAAGGCMLLRAVLHWGLFYSPLRDVPRRAIPVVRAVFVTYVLMAVSIMGVAVETGIAPDDCFAIDCGPASQCIPLTGSYQCDCTEGRSEKLPSAASSKDVCIDINECLVGTHTCHEDHEWCINTEGDYECGSCDVGSYASDDGQCTVKVCFNSGKLMPGQRKISTTQGGFTGHLDNGDFFGSAVTVLGDVNKDGVVDLAVGAYRDDDGGGDNSGAVYVVFMGTDGTVKAHQKISATQGGLVGPIGAGDEFGIAVAGLGDVDKDGVEDMVVGAHHDGDGGIQAGAVYVVFLHANGTVKAEQKISKTQGGFTGWVEVYHNLGRSVAAGVVGDVNGDGVVDLVMGSGGGARYYGYDDDRDAGGALFVVMLEPNGMVKGNQMTTFNATCSQFNFPFSLADEWAWSLTSMGDIDGDGVPDIAVGAPGEVNTNGGVGTAVSGEDNNSGGGGVMNNQEGGAVYLLMLTRDGTTKDARKIATGHGGLSVTLESNSRFGSSIASVGDLNGDGIVDLVVGAAGDDDGGSDRGSIHVLLLSTNGAVVHEQKVSSRRGGLLNDPLHDGDSFGWGLASGGDWDGDGAPDLLVGTHGDDDGGPDRGGAVYLLEVPPGFVTPCSGDMICVDTGPGNFSCSTDVNECLVSGNNGGCEQLCYSHAGGTSCGCEAGFVLDVAGTCTAGNFTCTTGVLMQWEQKISSSVGGGPRVGNHDWFGFSAAPLGDVDGDGVTDLVVGAPNDSGGVGGLRRGAAYILLLNPSGTVKAERKISSSSSEGGLSTSLKDYDIFGASVAGVGDLNADGVADMVVGAPGDNAGGGTNRGAVYVLFLNSTGTVNVEQKISAVDGGLAGPLDHGGGEFGASVASLGDLNGDGVVDLAVGARFDDDGGFGRGAVYVLLMRANGTVTGEQKLSSTQGGFLGPLGDFDAFGWSVAGVGDVNEDGVVDLAVGAPYHDDGDGGMDQGAVYVLLMEPNGSVKREQKISSTEGGVHIPLSNNDVFGGAIAGVGDLDGDGVVDMVVGASHDDDGGTNRGAVYVVLLQASGAVKAAGKISSTQGGFVGPLEDNDGFGSSVGWLGDLNGDGVMDMAVGSVGDDDESNNGGAIYVLKVAPGFVDQGCPPDGGTSETCGGVGEGGCRDFWEDTTTRSSSLCARNNGGCEQQCTEDSAGVFLFCGCDAGFIRDKDNTSCIADTLCHPGELLPGGQTKISSSFGGLESPLSSGGMFGSGVASIGDLNGDGVEDLVVGAPGDDSVYVLLLHTTGAVKTEYKIASSQHKSQQFGHSVGALGDLNGDGVVDIVVGAPLDDDYADDAGALYVLFLHVNGTVKGEQKITTNQGGLEHQLTPRGTFGYSVAGIGDLDGDGVGDLVAGAPRDTLDGKLSEAGNRPGAVWVLRLKTDGTVKQAQKINRLEGGLNGGLDLKVARFGIAVGKLGDWNGDGVVDLAVGSLSGNRDTGSVVALLMDEDGVVISEPISIWTHYHKQKGGVTGFGISVASVGDLDGDGVIDLVVGSSLEGGGEVYVFLLHETGTVKAHHKISSEHGGLLHPLEEADYFGFSLAILGGVGGEEQGEGEEGVRLVVGARGDDDGGLDRGAIYLLQVPPGYVTWCDTADAADARGDTCLNTGKGTSMCVVDYFPGSCEWNMGGCDHQCYDTVSGNSWCGCDPGYFLDSDGATCTDVDECKTNNGGCQFTCVNTIGGFSCACDSAGYELSSDGTVCHDINECEVDNGGCGTELCLNHAGGFWCGCDTLYVSDSNGECIDLDECTENNGGCEQLCVNRAGGFSCDCPVGYEVEVNGTCTEVDECAVANGGCGLLSCFNQPGSFSCGCDAGYDLNADRTDCIDLFCSSIPALLPGVTKISSTHGGLGSPVLGSGGEMGSALVWIGDVDGDMVPDLAVGAHRTNDFEGVVYIMMMTSTGTVKSDQEIRSNSTGTGKYAFGFSVASLGDVDGDRVPDIAVGSIYRGDYERGAVYVMFLLPSGEVKGEQEIGSDQGGLVGPLADEDAFGSDIAGLGDIDGDGVPDMVVGAKGTKLSDARGQLVENVGAVYVLGLKASGEVKWEQRIMGVRGRMAVPDDAGRYGWSVTALGDVNVDGVGDIAVGNFFDHDGGYRRGAVYVVFLAPDGALKGEQKISSTEGGLASYLDDNDRFGVSVSALGDMDGDGVPDLTVGSHYDSDSGAKTGAVYLLLLRADGTVKKEAKIRAGDLAPTWIIQEHDRFGFGVSAVRDFNGIEGVVTLAVGTPRDDDGGSRRGAVYVIRVPVGFMGLCDTDAGETCVNTHDGSVSCTTTDVAG